MVSNSLKIRSYKNAQEREHADAEMAAQGLVKTGVYGGISASQHGSHEVGCYSSPERSCECPEKISAGYRRKGWIVCLHCMGRIG